VADGSRARARLLVLGAGAAQLGLLRAARERDLFVVAVDSDPAAVGFRYADKRALVSSEDEPAVQRVARAEQVDGVISPGADWPVAIAARLAEGLGLPHPIDSASAVLVTSKRQQRARLEEAGVPQPRLLAEPSAPCIVKAPDRQGQRGLTLVRRPEELPAAIATAVAASRHGDFLAEELVDGPEVTVNAVSVRGVFHPLTVTDRVTADPPAFGVALAHAWPSQALESACVPGTQAPAAVAARAATALGIREGPTYTQLRLGREGPKVVELAARLGGGHDAELCDLALGIDLNGLALAFALGKKACVPGTQAPHLGGACVLFLVAPEGELRTTEGVDDALSLEGIAEVRLYRQPGHRFGPLRRGADRAGAVLATGATRDDALERARSAASAIRFVVG
jgi:biotin carboxylase